MGLAEPGHQSRQRRVPHHGRRAGLVAPEQDLAGELLRGRNFREQRACRRWRGDVQPRDHPARRALEHLDEARGLHQLRDDLDGAGTRADHRHALAGEVVIVIPVRTVDLVAFVGVESADVGPLVVRQGTGGQHHGAGLKSLAAGGFTVHTPSASSNDSPLTSTPNWIRRRRSKVSTMSSMCLRISSAGSKPATSPGS